MLGKVSLTALLQERATRQPDATATHSSTTSSIRMDFPKVLRGRSSTVERKAMARFDVPPLLNVTGRTNSSVWTRRRDCDFSERCRATGIR